MFVGPAGVGKRTFAFALGKALLCRKLFPAFDEPDPFSATEREANLSDAEEFARFQPCGKCESCRQFDLRLDALDVEPPTHPDFHYVSKPADRSLMPLSLLVGDREDRSQEGLCSRLRQSAFLGGRKIAVVDDADFFNAECANALLKTLEEPPQNTVMILIGTSVAKQLPTIRSRCQIFRFAPLANDDVAEIVLRLGLVASPEEADSVARFADGSIEEARRALDSDFAVFKNALYTELSRERLQGVELATKTIEYVDKVSKEAIVRRPRLRNALKATIAFYRALYATLEGCAATSREARAVAPFVKRLVDSRRFSSKQALDAIDRALLAMEQVDQNGNLPFIAEAWAYDTARIMR